MIPDTPTTTVARGPIRRVGSVTFSIDVAAPADARQRIDDAFGDIDEIDLAEDAGFEPQITVRVVSSSRIDGAVMYQIDMLGHPRWRTDSPTAVVDHIVTTLSRLALDAEPDSLHLHAGLLVDDRRAVLVVGPSGAGKSTIVASSARAGLRYVTDEMVSIDPDTARLSGLLKPLTLKNESWDLFQDVLGERPPDGARWAVRASRLGPIEVGGDYTAQLVVFPRYVPDAPLRITELHPATGLLRLLTDNLDMERYGPAGLQVLARVVGGATALAIEYSDANEAVTAIRSRLMGAPPAGSDPTAVPSVALKQTLVSPHRSATTASVVLKGRAVLYDETCGQMAELDEAATLWWLGLDGDRTPEELAAQFADATSGETIEIMAAAQQLFANLSKAGFLL